MRLLSSDFVSVRISRKIRTFVFRAGYTQNTQGEYVFTNEDNAHFWLQGAYGVEYLQATIIAPMMIFGKQTKITKNIISQPSHMPNKATIMLVSKE